MGRQDVGTDPAVVAVLGEGRRRQRGRRMTRAKRRQAERDAARERVTLELDPRVVGMIRRVAEAEGCSPAGVVNLLVTEGLRRYVEGEVEFHGNRRESRSPRYEWVVEVRGAAAVAGELGEKLGARETLEL